MQTTSPSGSIHREWCCIISGHKQPLSLFLSLSRHPIMILRQTQADTRSVPIGRTVARERCRLNVDRICCLVHFRHENNCRIWIFITRELFILWLYRSNIRRWSSICSALTQYNDWIQFAFRVDWCTLHTLSIIFITSLTFFLFIRCSV